MKFSLHSLLISVMRVRNLPSGVTKDVSRYRTIFFVVVSQ